VCERLVGTLRREALDHLLILNEAHLRAVLAEYAAHYNAARPHQGIGQHVPDDDPDHPIAKVIDLETARVRRKRVLGGLISEYQAAAYAFRVTRGQRPDSDFRVRHVELAAGDVFIGGKPGKTLTLIGMVRRGHPQESATHLALELSSAAVRISGIEKRHVSVILQDIVAPSWVEDGRSMPEPGKEEEWLNKSSS
jgi:phenylpyruvate tautomerase PptA (4-oxalocrotonate tautomerase family)